MDLLTATTGEGNGGWGLLIVVTFLACIVGVAIEAWKADHRGPQPELDDRDPNAPTPQPRLPDPGRYWTRGRPDGAA